MILIVNKLTCILLITIVRAISSSASAQEDLEEYQGLDASQIQQLACMANDVNGQSESSIDNIGSILDETLTLYSEGMSEEELNSARNQANLSVSDLNLDLSIQQLCSGG